MRKWLLLVAALVVVILASLYYRFAYTYARTEPPASGQLLQQALTSSGIARQFTWYLPPQPAAKPALLFALHGSMSKPEHIRLQSGYGFERLAEQKGFLVVYPQGFDHHWNDCRKSADYQANVQNIDDPQFFRDMVAWFDQHYGIDRQRVFVTGHSNGGHMTYRLALEAPDLVRAVAPIAANMPVADNNDCVSRDGPAVSMAILNGTDDGVNPYEGGLVEILGNASRGTVMSADATAAWWRQRDGIAEQPVITAHLDRVADDGTSVDISRWGNGTDEIRLYRINGGGHTIPTPHVRMGKMLGNNSHEVEIASELWDFFSNLPPRPDAETDR